MTFPASTTEPQPSDQSKQREQEYLDRDRRLRENHRRRKFIDMIGGPETFERFTFETFDRRRAPAAYDAAVGFDRYAMNLYFWGPARVGKTHLATAIARKHFDQGDKVQIISMLEFKDRLRLYESEHQYADKMKFVSGLAEADILVIHEMGRGKVTELVQETLWSVLERRILARRNGLVVTSNFDLPHIGRMYGGTISERLKEMCEPYGILLFPPKPTGGHS